METLTIDKRKEQQASQTGWLEEGTIDVIVRWQVIRWQFTISQQ